MLLVCEGRLVSFSVPVLGCFVRVFVASVPTARLRRTLQRDCDRAYWRVTYKPRTLEVGCGSGPTLVPPLDTESLFPLVWLVRGRRAQVTGQVLAKSPQPSIPCTRTSADGTSRRRLLDRSSHVFIYVRSGS